MIGRPGQGKLEEPGRDLAAEAGEEPRVWESRDGEATEVLTLKLCSTACVERRLPEMRKRDRN